MTDNPLRTVPTPGVLADPAGVNEVLSYDPLLDDPDWPLLEAESDEIAEKIAWNRAMGYHHTREE